MIKVVARYQQFRAVKKMIKRLKEGKTPDEKGGIVCILKVPVNL